MIATIVCSALIIICLVIIIICATDDLFPKFSLLVLMLSMTILPLSLMFGYGSTTHTLSKETIEFLLEKDLNMENIELAKRYNREEHFGNNYWCRFKLRNEDLIDIDYYINKKIGADE